MNYAGYVRLTTDEEKAKFYESKEIDCEILENEYLLIDDEVYCYQDNRFRRVNYPTIKNNFFGTIKPRNVEQAAALDMLMDDDTTIKLVTGTWGTGKTLLLAASAIHDLYEGKFDKIVWIRNNVQVKDTDNLGALPGSELDKVLPYCMPLADHCGGIDGLMNLIEEGKLEVIPLGFLRGRSIKNSIIMCSEAENLTKSHIQLIIGRVDEGSIVMFDADTRQRDRVAFEKSKGVESLIDRLKGNKLFSYVHLVKSERSATAALADLLNDEE